MLVLLDKPITDQEKQEIARIKDGIFGGFRGRIGNVVGVLRNGHYHIRSAPARVRNPRTPEQQANRSSFGQTSKLAKRLRPFIKVTLSRTDKKTYRGAFISYNSGSAVRAEGESSRIDYPNLIVSAGVLKGPEAPIAERTTGGDVRVRWGDNSGEGNARRSDRALLLALSEGYIAGYKLEVAAREAGQDVLVLDAAYSNVPVHVYLCMASTSGQRFSDSAYLGLVE